MREYLQRLIAWIKGELAKIRLFKFPNATIFGQPTIQDGQVSGFSATNYLQFPFLVNFAGRNWQIDCAFTTGEDVTRQQNILDSAYGLAFAVRGGKLVIALSSDGSTWNLGEHVSDLEVLAETTYRARLTFYGSQYKVAVSTDGGETYTDYITYSSSDSLAPKQMLIGTTTDGAGWFSGSINMNNAYLTISEKVVWQGMDDAGLSTRMALDMSNIDDAGKDRLKHLAAPVIGTTTVVLNTVKVNTDRLYNLGTLNNTTIALTKNGLVTNEVPQWHFYFTAGANAPLWQVPITWKPAFEVTEGTLYEVDIQQVDDTYYGRVDGFDA